MKTKTKANNNIASISLDEKNYRIIGLMEEQLIQKFLVNTAPTMEENIEKVGKTQSLRYNWDGKKGSVFSKRVINKVKAILPLLDIQPHITPTGRNSFYLQYELPNKSVINFEVSEKVLYIVTIPYGVYNESFEETSRNISAEYINSKVKYFVKNFR